MLASFVIALRIDSNLALLGLGGEALYGLLFEVLRGHDTRFAEHLHRDVDKPFSLSGVLTEHPKREGRLHIGADGRVEFRLGLLTDEIIEHALAAFGTLASRRTSNSWKELKRGGPRHRSILDSAIEEPLIPGQTRGNG